MSLQSWLDLETIRVCWGRVKPLWRYVPHAATDTIFLRRLAQVVLPVRLSREEFPTRFHSWLSTTRLQAYNALPPLGVKLYVYL